MPRKNNQVGTRDSHKTIEERQPKHFEPRESERPQAMAPSQEVNTFFFAAFTCDDEIPPDLPRD